jgi:hypothetical protein
MLLLVGMWAVSFYNAMLLVRKRSNADQLRNTLQLCADSHSHPDLALSRCPAGTSIQADLHTWTVTMRQCRYRDLARSIWGAPCSKADRQLMRPICTEGMALPDQACVRHRGC